VLGFPWLSEEQLGFDPTVITAGDKRYIEIERNNRTERLILDKVIKRVPCVTGRVTGCWRAHCEGDESRAPLLIGYSWQYSERSKEGEFHGWRYMMSLGTWPSTLLGPFLFTYPESPRRPKYHNKKEQ